MPDVTDRLTPLELAAIRMRCDRDTVRVDDMLTLLAEVEAVREAYAEVRTERDQLQRRIDNARAWLSAEIGSMPTGDERNELARLSGFVLAELFPNRSGERQGGDG
ncbi:MAG TPA: hypothetical protein VGW74_02660 [Propionibacteriaceae bacterium]|nr:hypothetical protein [Propionibacteriaceae bacterium]